MTLTTDDTVTGNRRLISIIIPCLNEEAVFPHLRRELEALGERLERRHAVEFVLVDDGSTDRTWQLISDWARNDTRLKAISFSRNFGHQAALTCGYRTAAGEAIICMDADLQDPPEVIDRMIEAWEGGADIVFAIRRSRAGETRFKLWTASVFYRLLRTLGAGHIRMDSGDFRLMSRQAVDAFNSLPEYHRFIRGMVGWLGFKTAEVRYDRLARRAGETKYPLKRMVRFAMDAVISSSFTPLRLAYASALAIGTIFLGYLAVALVRYLLLDAELVPGWTSIILAIVGFGTANLIAVGLMGEYVGRIYEQAKGRPLYLVRTAQASEAQATTKKPPSSSAA